MKKFYGFIVIMLIVTAVSVWFVPGLDDLVERTFQQYLGRAAQ